MIPQHKIDILGSQMAYLEVGEGPPVVFLHGNPTSSYLWRNIMPHVAGQARCLAPDLIGMGDSDKLTGSLYRFVDHRRYLDAWFDAMGLTESVTLVVHDWGSALGFDWAHRNSEKVKAIVYMEAITACATTDKATDGEKWFYHTMRSDEGEQMVMGDNMFIDKILLEGLGDHLSEADREVYRAPYVEGGETRRPLLTWPREIPVDGEPADVHEVVTGYQAWMETNDVPKLFINVQPGVIMWEGGERLAAARRWSHQTEVVLQGDQNPPAMSTNHYVQEVVPDEIGGAIAEWLPTLSS